MKLTKKSETSNRITFTYDKPPGDVEGYLYHADGKQVSRTFNPNDLEVTFGKVASGKYTVEAVGFDTIARADWPEQEPEPEPEPEPIPTGKLKYRPPNYVGGDPREISSYQGLTLAPEPSFAINSGFTYNLDNSKDYFIKLGLKEWSSAPFPANSDFRTQIVINGGRNVVIVGGEVRFHATNWIDDSNCLRVLGGDPNGTVYVEGVKMQACNGPTWSTPRDGVFQYCWIKAETYKDNHASYPAGDGVHPDVFQIWTGGVEQAHVKFDMITGYTRYTGLTQLIGNLGRWTRDRTDLHFMTPQAGGQQVGNYMNYLWSGTTIAPTIYDGGANNWMDLGWWGGIREQLQMAIDSPSVHVPAWVVRHNGQDYPGTDPNQYRGANVGVGATQGDEYRVTNPSTVTERWKWGKPTAADGATNGVFVPESAVGVNYQPVGYA